MAGLNFIRQHVETLARGRVLLVGSFDCNGSSNPADLQGDLAKLGSIVHTATGTYTYTFSDKPGKILEAWATFEGDKTHGDEANVQAKDESAGTLTIVTRDAVADTDIGSGENMRVVVCVWVSIYKNLTND